MPRILLADPNPEPYMKVLQDTGYEVIHGEDMDESLAIIRVRARIRRVPIDILVTEVNLYAGQRGLQLANKILSEYPTMPVIVHTSDEKAKGFSLNKVKVDHFIVKDGTGKNLLKKLKEVTSTLPYKTI